MYQGRIYSLELNHQPGIGPEDINHLWLLKQHIHALRADLKPAELRLGALTA